MQFQKIFLRIKCVYLYVIIPFFFFFLFLFIFVGYNFFHSTAQKKSTPNVHSYVWRFWHGLGVTKNLWFGQLLNFFPIIFYLPNPYVWTIVLVTTGNSEILIYNCQQIFLKIVTFFFWTKELKFLGQKLCVKNKCLSISSKKKKDKNK